MQVWLSRTHFDLNDPWEHIDFQVHSSFDVVAGRGWRITEERQFRNELWIVLEGSVTICQHERSATVSAPGVALLTAGLNRDTFQVGSEQLAIVGFAFDATLFGALNFVSMLELPLASRVAPEKVSFLVERMVEEARHKASGYSLSINGLGQIAFVDLLRADGGTALARLKRRLIQSAELSGALELIATSYDAPLTVAQMARAAHLSPKHFGKKFHEVLGLTPMNYLRSFRLQRARELLAGTNETAASIAQKVGLQDAAYFTRSFKAHYGVTPGAFRRSLGV